MNASNVNPADWNPATIMKAAKDFAKRLNSKDIKFSVKVRNIHKIEKKNSICISGFGYEKNKKTSNLYIKKM